MTGSKEAAPADHFSTFIGLSIAAHVVVVAVFTVKMYLFPTEPIDIRSAIRVDVVDLPDKVEKPAPPAPKALEPEPVAATPPKPEPRPVEPKVEPKRDKVDLKRPEDSQKKALEKLKALQAIEQLKEEVDSQKKPAPTKPPQYKGNVISRGDSLTGLEKIQYDEYFTTLKQRVKENWDLPQWLADAGLKAEAVVQIDDRGLIVKRFILTSSGNDIFDSRVLQSIDKGAPYPPPPGRLQGYVATNGIVFGFP